MWFKLKKNKQKKTKKNIIKCLEVSISGSFKMRLVVVTETIRCINLSFEELHTHHLYRLNLVLVCCIKQ